MLSAEFPPTARSECGPQSVRTLMFAGQISLCLRPARTNPKQARTLRAGPRSAWPDLHCSAAAQPALWKPRRSGPEAAATSCSFAQKEKNTCIAPPNRASFSLFFPSISIFLFIFVSISVSF